MTLSPKEYQEIKNYLLNPSLKFSKLFNFIDINKKLGNYLQSRQLVVDNKFPLCDYYRKSQQCNCDLIKYRSVTEQRLTVVVLHPCQHLHKCDVCFICE